MRKYFDAVVGGALITMNLALGPFLHRWRTRWNATKDEVKEPRPGDDIVQAPTWTYTHAITILAPRAAVWPWLVQIGQNRGGFFSYEVLENLVGCDIHNILELRRDLQELRAGDPVLMHANGFGPKVAVLDPERALVLGGPPDDNGSQVTWGFYLQQTEGGGTRLIERGRHAVGKGIVAKLGFGPYLLDPVGFVMSRRMLKTIKRLAETAPWKPQFVST
jgi:hypothetical protein